MALKWSGDEVFAFLEREFPQALHRGLDYEVVSLEPDALDLRASADDRHLRPGGTISGPTIAIVPEYKSPSEALLKTGLNLFTSTFRTARPDMFDMVLNTHSRLRPDCSKFVRNATRSTPHRALSAHAA